MIVFRLTRIVHAHDLTGAGARLSGGRWNSKGTPLLYTRASRALCVAEIAVHLPLGLIPKDYSIVSIEIPEESEVQEIEPEHPPADWDSFPHPSSTRVIGDQFAADRKALVLRVPSAVVQGDFNYLISPAHHRFTGVEVVDVRPFTFDDRMFVRGRRS